ncbi:TonB-dependent receptor domain-containing protein [Peristeroidobacter agariperforans]|uniref:TonB-dependent receptor domain-containing protein n=1 Tax=Peristeroidobacter agariperforans TaxID=268404 RepID=UPI00101B95D6|nr:TonB-dependent receptor [Peristeroidobacter agariperforans]
MPASRSLRASVLAALTAAAISTGPAIAQEQTSDQATPTAGSELGELETVLVTGSSIRGAVPVGSNMVAVGQDTIEKTAAINLSSLVNTVPAISTSGSLAQGENVFSYYSPQIHSLAGSSSNTTLVVADGLRIPGGGTQFNQSDPNIIPISAIQRVEVLADGASSVYGSDAVAGVVNFITRRTFDGFESNVAYGFADGYDNLDLNMIWGHTWETGGVYFASQYNNSSELMARDRPFTSRGDYRPVGSNNNSFQCSPSTMTVTGVSSGVAPSGVFLSPDATATVSNTPSNAPCNNSLYATLVPEQYRLNGLMKIVNEFSDRLTVIGMVNFNRQRSEFAQAPGGLTSATAFGPGQGVLGQQNPFFRAPAGAPNATRESVTWLALREDGDYGTAETQADVAYATLNISYELGNDWSVSLEDGLGWNRSAGNAINTFCTACALLALNGTAQANGNPTASNIAGQNVVALNMPLTTSNALDVWSPLGSNLTSPAVLRQLYSANTENTNFNTTNQTRLTFQGPVFDLPAGQVKVAVGAEYFWHEQTQKISGSNNTGPTTTGSTFRVYNYDRNVKSAFAEVLLPVISSEMGIPFVHQFDLNISGRYDEYSDVGDTKNPKYAFNWDLTPSFRVRGNYASAFVAPPLAVIGDPSQGYLYASGSVGPTGTINVPVANYPDVVNVPGAVVQNTNTPCTASSDVCTIGQGNLAMRRQLGGGFSNMVPQKGRSWSFGVDFAPEWLPGFTSAVTFFHNKFIGGVSSPSPTAIVNSRGLNDLLTICPSGCTEQQILEFANVANGASINGAVPPVVYYMIDQSSRNALNLLLEGIDYTFMYDFSIGNIDFTVGDSASYFTKYTQNFGGGTEFDILDTSGFNTTFPSIRFKHRAQVGMELNGFSADVFWNHTGGYKNWSSSSVNPIIVQSGVPVGGGDDVDAANTFDLHAQYMFGDASRFKGWIVSLDVRNVTDEEPSFYNGNTSGIFGNAAGWGYNGFVSNPVGRLVTLGLRTRM